MAKDALASLLPRLVSGRPIMLGADVGACLRKDGAEVEGPGALGLLVRSRPDVVARHYAREVDAGVEVLTTLTSDTTALVLAQIGMAYRAAAITGQAVDLASEAAEQARSPVAVAGTLGGSSVAPSDVALMVEEHGVHAARLSASGVHLVLARGIGSRTELMAAVVAAANTELPTWAVVGVDAGGTVLDGEEPGTVIRLLETAGAAAIVLEASTVASARAVIEAGKRVAPQLPLGLLLDASPDSVETYPDSEASADAWAERVVSLLPLGLRIVGGGHGSTLAHIEALRRRLASDVPIAHHPSNRPTADHPDLA